MLLSKLKDFNKHTDLRIQVGATLCSESWKWDQIISQSPPFWNIKKMEEYRQLKYGDFLKKATLSTILHMLQNTPALIM